MHIASIGICELFEMLQSCVSLSLIVFIVFFKITDVLRFNVIKYEQSLRLKKKSYRHGNYTAKRPN